jgi:hypothetical protein
MTYRDTTFCAAYPRRCKNINCRRAFTRIEREMAGKWWGDHNAPVAYADFYADCKDKVPA